MVSGGDAAENLAIILAAVLRVGRRLACVGNSKKWENYFNKNLFAYTYIFEG